MIRQERAALRRSSRRDLRNYAAELVALAPDVLVATASSPAGALLQATRSVPIVFTNVPDPVGAGFVDSLARPGGNATGFLQSEYGMSSKWLELLKEIAPRRDAHGGAARSRPPRRYRAAWSNPGSSAIAQD
jgi:ABC-type uncharacterized transport system substrate-binding protein